MIFKIYLVKTRAAKKSAKNFVGRSGKKFYILNHILGNDLFSCMLETQQNYCKSQYSIKEILMIFAETVRI